jgi:hypothetical protein
VDDDAMLPNLTRDLTLAARGLRRTPAFEVVVALTLALGIGGATTLFTDTSARRARDIESAEALRAG